MVIGDSLQTRGVGVRLNPAVLRGLHSQTRFWVESLNAFFDKGKVEQLRPANDMGTGAGDPNTFAAFSYNILHNLKKKERGNLSGFEIIVTKRMIYEENNDDDGDQDQKEEGEEKGMEEKDGEKRRRGGGGVEEEGGGGEGRIGEGG